MTAPTADTTDPGMDPGGLSRRVLDEQVAAINAHDVARFVSFYAEDAVVVDPQYPEPLRGRAAIERDIVDFLRDYGVTVGVHDATTADVVARTLDSATVLTLLSWVRRASAAGPT